MRFLIVCLLLLSGCFAQIQAESNICISVVLRNNNTLGDEIKTILQNKLLGIVTKQGVASSKYGAIVIVPEVSVANSRTINAGLKQIFTTEFNITVMVKNIITHTVFNTIQISSVGEGYSFDEARLSAMNKIDVASPMYAQFINTTKRKIENYYHANTEAIIEKAKMLSNRQLFDEALALLSAYPESLSGYPKIANAMVAIFNQCRAQYCEQILLSAQAAYSQRNYSEAASLIATIAPHSACRSQAQRLLTAIEQSTKELYRDIKQREKERLDSDERIKTAQIRAIRAIASAYLQHQTQYIFF